jgi:hypothetical protein
VRLSFAPATVRIEFRQTDAHHKRRQAALRRCPVLGGEQTCWADGQTSQFDPKRKFDESPDNSAKARVSVTLIGLGRWRVFNCVPAGAFRFQPPSSIENVNYEERAKTDKYPPVCSAHLNIVSYQDVSHRSAYDQQNQNNLLARLQGHGPIFL